MPGLCIPSAGARPSANLMEVQASEAHGHQREVGSAGSVAHTCEPTNRHGSRGASGGRGSVR